MKGDNSKGHEAYSAMKDLLLNHELVQGQNIIYRDLEEKLKMSRTPIINALNRLEQEGFVVSKANYGFYVKETSLDEVAELFEIREKLEEIAIDFVPRDLVASDLKSVKTALENYRRYKYTVYDRKRLDLDMQFHIEIANLGKRPFFTNLMQGLYENFYFRLNTVLLTPFIERFMSEHELLYTALANSDFKAAKRIARRHQKIAQKIMLDKKRR